MADNVTLNPGSGGAVIASDEAVINSVTVQVPIGKVAFGALDTATLVTSSVGLPVGDAGGSLTVDSAQLPSALVSSALSVTEKAPWGWGYTRPYSDALPQEVISSGGVTNSIAVLGGTSPVLQDVRGFNKIVLAFTVNYRSGAAITGFTIRLLARSRLQNGTVPPDIGLATTNAVDTALQGYGSKDLTITFGTSFSSSGRTFYVDALSLLGIPLAGDIDVLCGTVGGNADVYLNAMFGSS